ncbi:MAG TPA: hypothetical protein VH165_20535 [Kofleriaceae bacterium]|nr:hypothetical protein [Kofleriaceae bacterium]
MIGYEGVRGELASPPLWLHSFRHQFGGHGCMQFEVTGCALPLAANQQEGTGKLWLLTRALVELGESFPGDHVYSAAEVADLVAEICCRSSTAGASRAPIAATRTAGPPGSSARATTAISSASYKTSSAAASPPDLPAVGEQRLIHSASSRGVIRFPIEPSSAASGIAAVEAHARRPRERAAGDRERTGSGQRL